MACSNSPEKGQMGKWRKKGWWFPHWVFSLDLCLDPPSFAISIYNATSITLHSFQFQDLRLSKCSVYFFGVFLPSFCLLNMTTDNLLANFWFVNTPMSPLCSAFLINNTYNILFVCKLLENNCLPNNLTDLCEKCFEIWIFHHRKNQFTFFSNRAFWRNGNEWRIFFTKMSLSCLHITTNIHFSQLLHYLSILGALCSGQILTWPLTKVEGRVRREVELKDKHQIQSDFFSLVVVGALKAS